MTSSLLLQGLGDCLLRRRFYSRHVLHMTCMTSPNIACFISRHALRVTCMRTPKIWKKHVHKPTRRSFENLTGLSRLRCDDLPRHFCCLTLQAVQRILIQNQDCFSCTGNRINNDSRSTTCQLWRLPKFTLWIPGAFFLKREHFPQVNLKTST